MAVDNKQLAQTIIEQIGGKENIRAASPCMTRIRIRLKDPSKVDREALQETEGVMGVQGESTLQVVVGPGKAKKIIDIFSEDFGIELESAVTEDWEETKEDIKGRQQKGPFRRGLETIANIFIPLIPAIIAAGIFSGLSDVIFETGTENDFWLLVANLFALIGTGFLGYFAIFVGINSARQFGATLGLGGMIGAITISGEIDEISQILGLFNEAEPLESILTTGKGGIIGVIISVYILAKVEKFVRKRVPDTLDIILTPIISILVTTLIVVLGIMPLTGFLSDGLIAFLQLFIGSEYTVVNLISGFILAALFLPLVLVGMHHGLIPIYAIQLEELGGVPLFPVLAMAGAGQVGAALAIYLKARKINHQRMKSVIAGALPAGVLGIGEPLIYGVTLPLGKPFITAGLGAGFGGAFVMVAGVTAGAWGPSGLVAIPLMQGVLDGMVLYVIGLVISYIGGFIVTHFLVRVKELENV